MNDKSARTRSRRLTKTRGFESGHRYVELPMCRWEMGHYNVMDIGMALK